MGGREGERGVFVKMLGLEADKHEQKPERQ